MGLKINPEIQVSYSTLLEGEVVFDIACKLMGCTVPPVFKTHMNLLKGYVNSSSVRITIRDGAVHLVHHDNYKGIRLDFQEFIEYAAKQ